MDCTLILHTDGQREIRYGIDTVVDGKGIEQYTYRPLTSEQIEEIKNASFERFQEILSQLF